MRKQDLTLLWNLTLRIEMFVGIPNEGTITAFLSGYEAGTDNQCKFMERLSHSIETEYKIKSSNTWWIGQLEELAGQIGIEWLTAFKRQSLKVLVAECDDTTNAEFINLLKMKIMGKIAGIEYHFRKDWIVDWFGICDLSASWFKEIWTEKELNIMASIEEELKTYGRLSELPEKIQPTEKLKVSCKELLNKMQSESTG